MHRGPSNNVWVSEWREWESILTDTWIRPPTSMVTTDFQGDIFIRFRDDDGHIGFKGVYKDINSAGIFGSAVWKRR